MKKTAVTANVVLLLILGGYIGTLPSIEFNELESLLLAFALASPVAGILGLAMKGLPGRVAKCVAGIASTALLTTLFVYLIEHRPLQGLDLATDWPVLLLLACMLSAPVLSILALAIVRAGDKSKLAPTKAACSKESP